MDADFLLIQKVKKGDSQAIDCFVQKYYPKIFQYCQLHIRDYGHAEELTQETFMRFFRTLKSYQHYGKAGNYLYVIAANACKDYYKKQKDVSMKDLSIIGVNQTEGIDRRIDVEQALDKLPNELKEVVILFFFQELSQRDIAKLLNIKLSLVKYRVSRAKQLLAGYLER